MKSRFEVSTEGMRDLQRGRKPWQLAKELVANSFDEAASVCAVDIVSMVPRRALIRVYDNGPGFADIKDAWTLMGHTKKRSDPTVRGRFNIGEKEILSIAIDAKIMTSGKLLIFPKEGGRNIINYKTEGTTISCTVPWGPRQVEETVAWLKRLLPPKGIKYTVNGKEIPYQEPAHVIKAFLPTMIQMGGVGHPMQMLSRATTLEIHRGRIDGKSWLYEMGIPIQSIDCAYSVDVMQKVPMPPNRDVVRTSYLQRVYREILNELAEEVEEPSETWVRLAVEDKAVDPDAVKTIIRKRYGEKVVLWSSDQKANEKAAQAGYEIIHGRTLSAEERARMESAGLEHSSDKFPTMFGNSEEYPVDKWTEGMHRVAAYAEELGRELVDRKIEVRFHKMPRGPAADYFMGTIGFNLSILGVGWFNNIGSETTRLIVHEIAHVKGNGHDWIYTAHLEGVWAKAVMLALEKPEIYKKYMGVKTI